MSVLHLGVLDLPHPGGGKEALTTGALAEILESKYGLYSVFIDAKLEEIADDMADSLVDAIDNVLAGAPVPANPFAAAEQDVAAKFIDFLDTSEIEKIGVRGTPTQAALDGVNHRLKGGGSLVGVNEARKAMGLKPMKGNKSKPVGTRRPSFIDTGVLRASTTAWVEKTE